LSKLREELTNAREQLRQIKATKGAGAETLERENSILRLEGEVATAELNLNQTTIVSPISGVLTKLDTKNIGAVISVGEKIASIAPDTAQLVIEAKLPTKNAPFIEKGMPAKLRFEAFPYQDYGIITGQVSFISPDVEKDEKLGTYYKVIIVPDKAFISANGKNIPLKSGLAVSIDIITGKKSLLSNILEPIQKIKS
jgi:hemolysin D